VTVDGATGSPFERRERPALIGGRAELSSTVDTVVVVMAGGQVWVYLHSRLIRAH
jgi:hypothetical protein